MSDDAFSDIMAKVFGSDKAEIKFTFNSLMLVCKKS